MQGKKNYQEKLFIKFQLSEHVPADNLYRRLNEIIDFNFLYDSTAQYYGKEGQKSIDPVVFMKLILAGYLENMRSDRQIVNTLRLRLDIRYFIGYDLEEELPCHSTLSRTRKLYGEHVFKELFKKVLKQCIANGMVSGRRQAIDSVYIKANAAMDSMLEKAILTDADNYGKELDANQDEPAAIIIELDSKKKDGEKKDPDSKKKSHPTGKTHYSPVDPDARLSTKKGKMPDLNYLGQISVDTATHMITHVQVFSADKKDNQCLPGMVAQVVSNLKENDIEVQEIVADTGFSSGKALKVLEAMGITGYIPNTGTFHYEHEGFVYHAEGDYYECKNGRKLTYLATYDDQRRYRLTKKHCKGCPFKDTCIGKKQEMAINDTIYRPYFERMRTRMQTRKASRLMKKRQSTVEPVIGTLVDYRAIKKVNSRGIDQANKCLTMAAIAYNIKKLLNFKPRHIHDNINELIKGINDGIYKVIAAIEHSLMISMAFIPE
jgi:transposase